MKLQLIHLSDMHFEKKEQILKIEIDKMMQAINYLDEPQECVIVISGDLAAKGDGNEYKLVDSFLGALYKGLKKNNYMEKKIEIVCVPGNHDIDFSHTDISHLDISNAYEEGGMEQLVNTYLNNMNKFFGFAKRKKCFIDDYIVSKKIIKCYDEKKIGFVMINTAPLSVLGGKSKDMGNHFLSDEQLKKIEYATEAEINVLVMHHSIEWFQSQCKDKLRKIISKKYSLVLTGHEHQPVGESRNINNGGEVQCIQGNALCGYTNDGNGFCTINIDMCNRNMVGYSFIWEDSVYVPKKILESKVKLCFGGVLTLNTTFFQDINKDNNRVIDDYYVFPSFTYNNYREGKEIVKCDIEQEQEFIELILKYYKIVIMGNRKSGKTVLAKRLFKYFLSQGKIPLLITASDINHKKIEKTIEYIFNDQYEIENNSYIKFEQMSKSEKVVLLDEANLISKNIFEYLLDFLERNFGKIIIFSEKEINFDVKGQVLDAIVEENSLHLSIKPFLYKKRKKLIKNILLCNNIKESRIEEETNKINRLINSEVRYFELDPEFIINFVNQYEKDFIFEVSSGLNVFNVVYENSIKNKIIEYANNIDATIIINILRELAYYMHFKKKSSINISDVTNIINNYGKEYRQKVNIRSFFDAVLSAKILVEMEDTIRFKDKTLVAYFVAQALNQKFYQDENIDENLFNTLKNLCFSINSDIVLFLALITNNIKFVNLIIEQAKEHFANQEELSFDEKNVSFLLDTSIPVKDSAPNDEERRQMETELERQEEVVKSSDVIELVDEYDYSEEDLYKTENQIMLSFKYLEILSKTLPAFCQNMKAEQQDILVDLIYKCSNKFLYSIFKDIDNDFDNFCNMIYDNALKLKRYTGSEKINFDYIREIIEQISAMIVISIYQLVALTGTTQNSIKALNEFDYNSSSNYKLQNLMMLSRVGDVSTFAKRALYLDKNMKNKIEKSIIKFTVREYLLRNNVEIYGDAQSLLDYFFGRKYSQELKMEIAKHRITENDRT